MKIKKALKEKNKLVAKIAQDYSKLTAYNSVEEGTERPYEPRQAMKDWIAGVETLIKMKTEIHKANVKVFEKIFRMAELKSIVKQLKSLDCTSGKYRERYSSDGATIKVAEITLVERDEIVKNYETEIETLQEELDEYNAKTSIQTSWKPLSE